MTLYLCLHVPAHKATNFTDLPMQVILLYVERILTYNLEVSSSHSSNYEHWCLLNVTPYSLVHSYEHQS